MKKKKNPTSTRPETFRETNNWLEVGIHWALRAFESAKDAHEKEAAGTLEPLDESWAEYPENERPANTSAEHLRECIENLEKALAAARVGFSDGPWACTRLFQHRNREDGSYYTEQCAAPAREIAHADGSTGWECKNGCRHWHYGSRQGERQMMDDERRWKEEELGY